MPKNTGFGTKKYKKKVHDQNAYNEKEICLIRSKGRTETK